MSQELIIKEEVAPIIARARSMTIVDEATMAHTVELLSQANKALDAIKLESDKVILPAKEIIEAENNRWKATVTALKEVVLNLRTKQGAYQTEKTRIATIEKQKIADRVGDGKGKLQPETASKKIGEVAVPAKHVVATSGSLSFRATQKLKVTDEKLIPREYLIVNETFVLASLKAGKRIPGAEIEIVQTPINKR